MAKKILLIEDDVFLRKVLVRKLLKEGYQVIEAIDGEKGLKSIEQDRPDLILLDLVLPEIDGFEVLAKMKADKTLAKIPVIILSNLGEKKEIRKGLEMGVAGYLIKAHFTPGEIMERIENALSKNKKEGKS